VAEAIPLTDALLERLAEQWRRHDAPIARRLAPGLTDQEMDALTEPLGLRVPPEARTWWRWHNGARDASILTGGGKAFASLERCVSLAAQIREIAREAVRPYGLSAQQSDEQARGIWNWDWLPLSEDGVGTMLVIDAAVENPRALCPVSYRGPDHGTDDAVVVMPSIGALVQEWTRALETGRGVHVPQTDQWALDFDTLPHGFDRRLL